MSLVAGVENGQLIETTTQSTSTTSSNNSMDKDAFLQLLVAQMKYQDPLEPTSNTEYISQYAQFSQVEQMQSMAASMDLQRASQLVGQEVYVKTTTTSGETKYVQGKVDYVVYENGKAYLSIGESLYSLDDLDTVTDSAYMEAYDMATELVEKLNQLPGINAMDLSDATEIEELYELYNSMNDYQKSFVATEKVETLEAYMDKLEELRIIEESSQAGEDSEQVTEDEA